MRTVKIEDFLTDAQVERCCALFPDRTRIRDEVIKPNMAAINHKLGQENDPDYLSYAVAYAIENREPSSDEMSRYLREISDAASAAVWETVPVPTDPSARAYTCSVADWRLLVFCCAVEDGRDFDGTGTKDGVILHLTRDLAESLFADAQRKTGAVS